MAEQLRKATHDGVLKIGDIKIPCAVLEDGTRVLTENGITNALLGSRSGASKRLKKAQNEAGAPVPLFLAPGNLRPFISKELEDGPLRPLTYETKTSKQIVRGFDANVLPKVCEVWLDAREAGKLQAQQLDKAKKAEILMRGLAHVGIVGLVDEATGFQEVRDRMALQAILDAYLKKELAAWAKTFPDEFYREIFRLRGWQWKGMKVNRPQVVGHYTNDVVYERLAPGILEELKRLNPRNDQGQRPAKHTQWLTEDVGHPALAQHLHAVIGLMRASAKWDQFHRLLQRAFPKKGQTIEMPFDD